MVMADPSNGGTGKVTADRLEDFISEALDKLRDVRQAVDETVSEIPTGKLQPGFHLQGTSYLAQRLRTVLNGPSRPGSLAALATSISTDGKHHIISQHANSQQQRHNLNNSLPPPTAPLPKAVPSSCAPPSTTAAAPGSAPAQSILLKRISEDAAASFTGSISASMQHNPNAIGTGSGSDTGSGPVRPSVMLSSEDGDELQDVPLLKRKGAVRTQPPASMSPKPGGAKPASGAMPAASPAAGTLTGGAPGAGSAAAAAGAYAHTCPAGTTSFEACSGRQEQRSGPLAYPPPRPPAPSAAAAAAVTRVAAVVHGACTFTPAPNPAPHALVSLGIAAQPQQGPTSSITDSEELVNPPLAQRRKLIDSSQAVEPPTGQSLSPMGQSTSPSASGQRRAGSYLQPPCRIDSARLHKAAGTNAFLSTEEVFETNTNRYIQQSNACTHQHRQHACAGVSAVQDENARAAAVLQDLFGPALPPRPPKHQHDAEVAAEVQQAQAVVDSLFAPASSKPQSSRSHSVQCGPPAAAPAVFAAASASAGVSPAAADTACSQLPSAGGGAVEAHEGLAGAAVHTTGAAADIGLSAAGFKTDLPMAEPTCSDRQPGQGAAAPSTAAQPAPSASHPPHLSQLSHLACTPTEGLQPGQGRLQPGQGRLQPANSGCGNGSGGQAVGLGAGGPTEQQVEKPALATAVHDEVVPDVAGVVQRPDENEHKNTEDMPLAERRRTAQRHAGSGAVVAAAAGPSSAAEAAGLNVNIQIEKKKKKGNVASSETVETADTVKKKKSKKKKAWDSEEPEADASASPKKKKAKKKAWSADAQEGVAASPADAAAAAAEAKPVKARKKMRLAAADAEEAIKATGITTAATGSADAADGERKGAIKAGGKKAKKAAAGQQSNDAFAAVDLDAMAPSIAAAAAAAAAAATGQALPAAVLNAVLAAVTAAVQATTAAGAASMPAAAAATPAKRKRKPAAPAEQQQQQQPAAAGSAQQLQGSAAGGSMHAPSAYTAGTAATPPPLAAAAPRTSSAAAVEPPHTSSPFDETSFLEAMFGPKRDVQQEQQQVELELEKQAAKAKARAIRRADRAAAAARDDVVGTPEHSTPEPADSPGSGDVRIGPACAAAAAPSVLGPGAGVPSTPPSKPTMAAAVHIPAPAAAVGSSASYNQCDEAGGGSNHAPLLSSAPISTSPTAAGHDSRQRACPEQQTQQPCAAHAEGVASEGPILTAAEPSRSAQRAAGSDMVLPAGGVMCPGATGTCDGGGDHVRGVERAAAGGAAAVAGADVEGPSDGCGIQAADHDQRAGRQPACSAESARPAPPPPASSSSAAVVVPSVIVPMGEADGINRATPSMHDAGITTEGRVAVEADASSSAAVPGKTTGGGVVAGEADVQAGVDSNAQADADAHRDAGADADADDLHGPAGRIGSMGATRHAEAAAVEDAEWQARQAVIAAQRAEVAAAKDAVRRERERERAHTAAANEAAHEADAAAQAQAEADTAATAAMLAAAKARPRPKPRARDTARGAAAAAAAAAASCADGAEPSCAQERVAARVAARLEDYKSLEAQQDAEARAKDALRAPVRDALQRRLCKALDSRDLPRLLRDLQALPKGELISNDGLKRALRHAKARFHPDKVRAAQQAAATAAQAAGGSGKARKGGVNGCGLTKTALEEVVRAEELSKILNSWDVRNL